MSNRSAARAAPAPLHAPAALELTLYHDVLCAWSYVALQRLEVIRHEYGSQLRWKLRGFPLRPDHQHPSTKERKELAKAVRAARRAPEGKGLSTDLWTGDDPPASTLSPLVALEAALAQCEGLQRELLHQMREAAFRRNINVSRRDVILEMAARAGLDLSRFLTVFDDPRTTHALLDEQREAEALGVRGVPALVIEGEWLVQGCRTLDDYRTLIEKYLREHGSSQVQRTVH